MAQQILTDLGLLLTFGTSLLAFIASRQNRVKIGEVHQLVNNQLDRQLDRNAELTATLTAAGVDVPQQQKAAGADS